MHVGVGEGDKLFLGERCTMDDSLLGVGDHIVPDATAKAGHDCGQTDPCRVDDPLDVSPIALAQAHGSRDGHIFEPYFGEFERAKPTVPLDSATDTPGASLGTINASAAPL